MIVWRAMSDQRGVGDEKSRIEAAGAAGRGDRAGDEIEPVERGKHAGCGKARPCAGRGARRRAVAGDAERQAGFLERLADRGKRQRPREARRRAAGSRVELFLDHRIKRAGRAHAPIARLDPTAGEDEFARHEFVRGVASSQQHTGAAARMIEKDQRRRVARPRGGRFAQSGFIAQRVRQVLGNGVVQGASSSGPPKPCMRSAH